MIKIISLFTFILFSTDSFSASKCENQWQALKSVQTQLRHKSTEFLRKQEHEKHTDYQNCRKNKNANNSKTKTTKNSTVQSSNKRPSHILNKRINRQLVGNKAITIKGYFEGEKQNQWLKFYQRPKYCHSPKSTQVFAKCMQHKEEEAIKFEQKWQEQHLPSKFTLNK